MIIEDEMIAVETVDLTSFGIILPHDRVGMVIAQPYLSLTASEPYRCKSEAKASQLSVLNETLAVACSAPHGAEKTHFTVFPEYSIPGLEGVALIDDALRDKKWQCGTIVIGGTDALSKADFTTLANDSESHLDNNHNGLEHIADAEWINCCIIWIKTDTCTVKRWLQPKLFPAWEELDVADQGMFQGKSVFTFKGLFSDSTQYHFSSLICFDWVAKFNDKRPWACVLDMLQSQITPNELSLSWFFVIQYNPKPSHDSFLTEVSGFFNQNIAPHVRRDRTCLVFANCAGGIGPGRATKFGGTSLIFSPQAQFAKPSCHMTFSNGGHKFRSSTLLSPFRDVFFREQGACIHSFVQVNPGSLNLGPTGRMLPVENPFVFPLNKTADPRTPKSEVPASIKWLNDELDTLPSLSQFFDVPLKGQADNTHKQSVLELRKISPKFATTAVNLATAPNRLVTDKNEKTADEWSEPESQAVEHLVFSLDIIGIGFTTPIVGTDCAHATAIMNGQSVDIIAIRGKTHEDCINHSNTVPPPLRRQVLLISRDYFNTKFSKRCGSFLEQDTNPLGQAHKITDPRGGMLHISYSALLNIFMNSEDSTILKGKINDELS